MKLKEFLFIIVCITVLTGGFFYKVITRGYVALPGDVLLSEFQPWRSASYDGYAAGGIPNKAQYPDTIRQLYPWRALAIASLKEGKLPLWNPYNFSGTPLLANFQNAALYPFNVAYLFMKDYHAWTLLVMLQPFLAFLFTYFYARKIGLKQLGSFLASISFGFSGFMAVWLEYNTVGHVTIWLPFILLSIESIRTKPHALWLVALATSQTMAIFAGHPQVYAYLLLFGLAYSKGRLPQEMWKYAFGFTLVGIGAASIQLIPGLELIHNAARSPHDPKILFEKILIQPWQLMSLAFPNFFGNPATRSYWVSDTFVGKVLTIGLVPLFFSLSALRNKNSIARWFLKACIVILALITANPLTYFLYKIPIPLITSSSPTLMSFLFVFSLSMLCGFGLDYWVVEKHTVKKLIRRAIEVVMIFAIFFGLASTQIIPDLYSNGLVVKRALMYGAGISLVTLILFWVAIQFPKLRTGALGVLLLVHVIDLFIFFNRFNPFVPKSFVFPNHPVITYLKSHSPDRYWGYGTANISANFASYFQFFSPEGYDPLYPAWYGELLYGYKHNKLFLDFDNTTRSDAAITSTFGDGGLSNKAKHKILAALSVRYVLDRVENASSPDTLPPNYFHPIHEYNEWTIFENTYRAPRAFIANDILYSKNSDEFSNLFFSDTFDPTKSVILPKDSLSPLTSASGKTTIITYKPEQVTILTESTAAGVLVITDTYFPGWQAKIDGIQSEIIPANWALRGIQIPKGRHTISMEYKPLSVMIGIYVSLGSLVAGVLFLIAIKKINK